MCVYKTWNSLISNPTPEFTIHNFNNSILQNNNNPIAIFNDRLSLKAIEYNPNNFSTVIKRFDVPTPPEYSYHHYFSTCIVGSCNGIVAVVRCYVFITDYSMEYNSMTYNSAYDLYLWNPFSKTHFRIPPVELPLPCDYTSVSVFGLGFGFDGMNCNEYKYKIIRVTDFDGHSRKRQVIVYSSKENCWGLPYVVEDVKDRFRLDKSGVLANNNVVHWIFDHPAQHLSSLRGFDLYSEKWNDLPLPNLLGNNDVLSVDIDYLQALDGCLCVMIKSVVWVMKEYGVQNSWTPLANLNPLFSPPIACSKYGDGHDEFLVRYDGQNYSSWCTFFWINLRNKSIKRVKEKMPRDVIVCAGSLIHVPNGVPDR